MQTNSFNFRLSTFLLFGLSLILIALVTVAVVVSKALPAGERFSLAEANGTHTDIYALDMTRGVRLNLTRDPASDVQEAWSPDGSRMAFLSDRGGVFQLYLLTIGSGGGVRQLDGEVASANYRPVWSPDGRSLAYEIANPNGSDIAVMEVDQPVSIDNPRVIAPSRTEDRYPVWSPDGSEIAFTSWRSGDAEIFIVKPDGSDLIDLTNSSNDDAAPAWSPDGTKLAFFSLRSQFRELYVMNRDGSDVHQLSDAAQSSDGSYWGAPLWSPDGRAIAYQTVIDSQPSIAVIGLDGSVKHLINREQALAKGERMAYLSTSGARALLYLIDADGSNPRVLTPIDATQPFSTLWTNPAS
jgi:TolB protein